MENSWFFLKLWSISLKPLFLFVYVFCCLTWNSSQLVSNCDQLLLILLLCFSCGIWWLFCHLYPILLFHFWLLLLLLLYACLILLLMEDQRKINCLTLFKTKPVPLWYQHDKNIDLFSMQSGCKYNQVGSKIVWLYR